MYLYVAITKKKVFVLPGKTGKVPPSRKRPISMTSKIHRKNCIGLHIALAMSYRQVQNTSQKMVWIAYCSCWLQDGFKMVQDSFKMGSRCLQDGPRWLQDGLLGTSLELSCVQLVAIMSQRKAIEGFILSQENHKYIVKNGSECIFAPRSLKLLYLKPKMPS